MEIPLELQRINDDIEQRIDLSLGTVLEDNTFIPEFVNYSEMTKRKHELSKLRFHVYEKPEDYTLITELYVIIYIRRKLFSLINDIKNGINVKDNKEKRDKLLNILPHINMDEIKYFFLQSYLFKEYRKKNDILTLPSINHDIIEKFKKSNDDNQIEDFIINIYKEFNEIGQYSDFDPDIIHDISEEMKRKVSELNI